MPARNGGDPEPPKRPRRPGRAAPQAPRPGTWHWPGDPAAWRLDRVIAAGGPMTEALRADGVRFVVVDGAPLSARDPRDARDTPAGAGLPGAVPLYYRPELVVYQVPR